MSLTTDLQLVNLNYINKSYVYIIFLVISDLSYEFKL